MQCFASTLTDGLRASGGIGDALKQISYTNDPNTYYLRFAFDLSFYVIVLIFLLNLVFGIIIDAFSSIRDNSTQIERDVKSRCFICGLSRIDFETRNVSWVDHVKKEHNVYAYLYFILYV